MEELHISKFFFMQKIVGELSIAGPDPKWEVRLELSVSGKTQNGIK